LAVVEKARRGGSADARRTRHRLRPLQPLGPRLPPGEKPRGPHGWPQPLPPHSPTPPAPSAESEPSPCPSAPPPGGKGEREGRPFVGGALVSNRGRVESGGRLVGQGHRKLLAPAERSE